MSSTHDVTIIVPVFCKTEEDLVWLDECLASACEQDAEVVVYDDGSLVDTTGVISKYSVSDFALGHKNHGAAYARNRATEMVRTKLLFPLDCDDRLKPGAIARLLQYWRNDVPVYCDFEKFGLVTDPHYLLMDFDCSHLLNFVGFTSVNVLHAKEQWKSIGGWREEIDFYEDGEYNARLMGTYCALHCPEPLVEYRIHSGQRTVLYKQYARQYALDLLSEIRRYDMPCSSCGGGRRSQSNVGQSPTGQQMAARRGPTMSVQASGGAVDLPTEFNGKVLARYVGGQGKGKHYYQGIATKEQQKVMYGDLVYVDPKDARLESEVASPSMYIRVVPSTPAPPAPAPVVKKEKEAAQAPTVPAVKKLPVVKEVTTKDEDGLPEISNMSYAAITALDLTPEVAKKLLYIEENNLMRRKVVIYLKSKAGDSE